MSFGIHILQFYFRKEDEIDKELHISGFNKELENEELDPDDVECLEELEDLQITEASGVSIGNNVSEDTSDEPAKSIYQEVESLKISEKDRFDELDPISDSVSNFSYVSHSTTSTIAPEIIHSRVKKALTKRSSAIDRKRCLAKGEASAVARKRKENKDVIKEYLNPSSVWG